jgi:DNA-binding GntR family transcriptional regulator
MSEELQLDANSYLPLRDVVYNTLRNAILRGELKPGERLMEMHLANKLGVSRTPIREAIHMLEQEGLAVTIPRKGAQVAKMTEKDLQDVLEIRDSLDELAVSMACKRMTVEQLDELREAMEHFKLATTTGEVRKIVEADEEFHNVIYRMANNPKLEVIVNNLKEQMYRYRYEYIKGEHSYDKLVEEHARIVEGFERQDGEYIKNIMHLHLENQIEAVRDVIREQE